MKTTDEFPRAMLDSWLAELGLVLREMPLPDPPAFERTPGALPQGAGSVPTNVAVSATSPAVVPNPAARGFYSEDAA